MKIGTLVVDTPFPTTMPSIRWYGMVVSCSYGIHVAWGGGYVTVEPENQLTVYTDIFVED